MKLGAMIVILADDHIQSNFINLIDKTTGSLFGMMKLKTNGLDANLYAVTSLTKGNTFGCLIACCSYISGDRGPLQSWSTSEFEIGSGPAGIIHLGDPKLSLFTLENPITLPYSIQGTMSDDDLEQYENECLEHLHIRCLYSKEMKNKITAIILEIILASNRATLSNHALTILGYLAHLHDFGLVVDEIMTSGRTKKMLLTLEKHKIFQQAVEFITMGKWSKCGMVLASKQQQTMLQDLLARQLPHGASTGIDGKEAYNIFSEVVNYLHNIDAR